MQLYCVSFIFKLLGNYYAERIFPNKKRYILELGGVILKKNQSLRAIQAQRFLRYSIRKFTVGVASVAIASGLAVLGGTNVQAAEEVNTPAMETKAPEAGKNIETDVAEKVNTSKLTEAIERISQLLEKVKETEKTTATITAVKELLTKAQQAVTRTDIQQSEVDKFTSELSSKAFVLQSMPKVKDKATEKVADKITEEKENKNQDPRNGKAIPGKGESGFRAVDTTAANAASEAEKYKGIRDAAIPELQANIDKIQAEIAKEEAKPTNKKDQFKIDVLKHIKQKAENVITTANAADTSSAQIMSQQAEAVKSERDLLALYLAGKADLGAPVSENHVAYGNNPTNGVFESLKEGFGDKVTFNDAVTKSERIAKQQRGQGEINARAEGIGGATYNWQEKEITKAAAESGVLNGWKIEKGEKVTAVKPLDVTEITDKDGAPSTRTVPKSKIYTNDGVLKQYQREGQQLSYNNGSGIIPTITPTIDAMKTNAFGEVKNRDYYLELGSKGTTISKEYDVNGNSRINVNLIHAGAYGHVSTTGTGEHVKLKIVDAFTGAEIKPVEGKSGPLSTEQGPGGGNGWTYMARLYDIPATTTKIKVLIEAGDQAGSQNGGTENQTQWGNTVKLKDGYLVGGIGIATAPAAEIVTDVSSGRNKNEYGYTPDTIYDKNQKGSFNFTLKDTAGMNINYYAASNVQVTIKVPKGVVLEDRVINANGTSAFLGNVYANTIKWTPNDPSDNSKGGTLTYNVPADKRMAAAEKTTRSSSIVFTTANNFIGPADFKVTATSGFGDTDAEGNKLYSYTTNGLKPAYENQFNRGGLANSDKPDFEYGKVIYINSLQATGTVTVPINTNDDQLKEVAYAKAQEEVNSANFQQLLRDMNATAAMGQITNVTLNSKDKVEITKIAADGRGVVKVPVTYTADGRTYDTTVDIEVNVVKSTTDKLVVFEGDKITNDQVKSSVTPVTIDTKAGVVNNPNEADVFSTTGKAGEAGLKIPTTVTHDSNGTNINETVEVPVTVLPKPNGEVQVHKGASVDKVKEVAKAKVTALVAATDFTGKLPTGATVTVGDVTEAVAETLTNEKGTNKGVVNVPATYTVEGKTYDTTIPVTINVLGSEPKTVYTVEGTKPDVEKVKNAVTPGDGGTVNTPKETDLPATTVKAGTPDVTVPTTVTYPTGDETVKVPVEVLPKATPEKVTTLKDTTGENLTTAVKEKAQAALGKLTLPSGVTAELDPNQTYAVPTTDSNGDKTAVPVKVQYKDNTGTVVAEDTINVPVTVVSSTPSKIVVFEGDEVTADAAKGAVTPGTDGTKGEPTTLPETAGKAGATDVKVDVPVTYDNGKLTETVSVPVTVLPKPEADEILVPKNGDKEKAKEKVLAQAKKAIEDATFKGKLPQGATVAIDETAPVTVPDLTDDTEVDVTVKYTVPGQDTPLTTTVKVPVTVVESVPQIVPVDEKNTQPNPEKSIDKTDYPEGSTFRYKTPEGQTTPIDVTTTGDKNVVVEVLDPQGNTIVEVPATVRVVDSTPQFVVADPAKKQPEAKDSVTPGEYPDGTTFEYKTPVDTTTAGEKDVVVVAKLNGQPIAEVPAKVVVVDPKTQYVVADPSKPQPDASKSIDPEQYPDGTTFEYKTPVDTTTPGEKDVVVVAKNGEDKLVEVPTKVKVVQGNPQIVPVDEGKKQPSPEDSIDPNDYPDDATFEYKEEVDTSKPGDKKVTVVVKQGDKVLVEVPSTVRVVEGYPKYVPVDPAKKQPDPKENINPNDFPTGTTFEYKDNTPVDTTTPGEKPVTVVAKLNGQPIVEIPATIVVVEPKTQYVPVNAENDKKPKPQNSITPDDYPEGSTFEYKTPEGQTTPYDGTTPGEKDVTVVVKDSDGDTIVEVPAKIKVVQGKEQLTPVNAEDKDKPKAEDSITPSDYPEGSTFEYKVPEGQTTPYDGTTPGDKPVTVVVKDKDGKVLVEVPATIKVVESKPTPIETPVTNTPLTKDDYTKGMKIPEGSTVKVGDLPDLTTPGEKTPVKVTITLPNGKSYTVDVPVTVTPVKEIETPVTTGKLTPEDILKQIKVPEGATTKVENIPDLTTPGKKDPVKVTVTLPNGKVVTVDVPVNVTPVKEIETPVTTTPLTQDDYTKGITIPEGGKITNVENIPDLTTPGKKNPVKVTIELPNGKVITVDVPVTVTPVKEIETPVTTGKLTPEDILKQIKVPEGATTKVENIPDLTTPGKKDPVKVTVTLPNGKVVTVDVPVTVTPVKEIETPVTKEKLTPEDILKQIKVPEGATTKVENIPDLTTPGKKDPVKVTITLPNGKVVTVDVPVTVTPVKEIETPVTTDKLTPEDILKQIKVPEGATTKVENIPDLTTPGKKDPVKVTVTLPNGKVVTVEVPVNVTPITPIETPVTKDKLTPEDILKQIKVPEGATVKVGDLPDLTTPGKKDPVKVTITLPNGKVVTVEIPVNVTPIEDIDKKEGDPITNEDVEKHIPKGTKVISIGDKPTTDVPGVRPSIPVVIELPNGIRVTMNIPVIVTPKVTPVVVSLGTPVTPEDVQKHIELPKGWTVTKVGEIPSTTTPGTKPVVPVEIELPDGRKITVDVPVIVTPTVRQIVVPQGTPITPDDVKGHIDLPKEPGWEIVEVGEIPTTIPAGVKPSVKVKIKVPTGEIIEVEVPIIVTPKVTPIVVEVGTPITKEDVKKKVGLPEGWEIVEIGEIPTTETPGTKPVVKVKVKLPDGRIITVEVPVTVTPKSQNGGGIISQNGDSTVQIVTEYLDENGNRITSDKEGKHNPIELEGYEFSHSTTDAKGNTLHHYKKVTPKTPQAVEEVPTTKPEQPSTTEVKQTPVTKQELPNTGTAELEVFTPAVLAILAGLGLAAPTVAKKKDEE